MSYNRCCIYQSKLSQSMTKPTQWPVRPAKTQISLGVRQERSVFAVPRKKAKVLSYSKKSAQSRLIRLCFLFLMCFSVLKANYFISYLFFLPQSVIAGCGSSIGSASALYEVLSSRPAKHSFVVIWSWNKFYGHSLPSADSRRAVVSYWWKNGH